MRRSFRDYSLDEQIRLAMPIARRALVVDGIGKDREHESENLPTRVRDMVGDDFDETFTDEQWHQYWDHLAAAQALGIALGMMLGPAFLDSKRGAR